jgi:hypothetical protein
MSKENSAGIGVSNFYGKRSTTEGQAGNYKTSGTKEELVVEITGSNIADVVGSLPAGATPLRAYVDVQEVFVVSTSGTLDIGTDGSETTNGFQLTEATLEAAGVTEVTTFNGTWADKLAAATTVGLALAGTATGGKARVVLEYLV